MSDNKDSFIVRDGTYDYRKGYRSDEQFEKNGKKGTNVETQQTLWLLKQVAKAIDKNLPSNFKIRRTGKKETVGSFWYIMVPKDVDTSLDLWIGYRDKKVAIEIQDCAPNISDFGIKIHKMKAIFKAALYDCNCKAYILHIHNEKPYLLSTDYLKEKICITRNVYYVEKDLRLDGKTTYRGNKSVLLDSVKLENTILDLVNWLIS